MLEAVWQTWVASFEVWGFTGTYVLLNMRTTLHRDVSDPPLGWAAMATFGSYEGGELCIADVQVKLPYRPRDIVFLRAWALKHFITKFKGIFFRHY